MISVLLCCNENISTFYDSILLQTRTVSLLRLSLKRHTETAVRATINVQRIAEELHKVLNDTRIQGQMPTSLLIFCNGYFTTFAGEGSLHRQFMQSKNISGCEYTGKDVPVTNPDDPQYNNSRLRHVTFDRAFTHCTKDAQDREYFP